MSQSNYVVDNLISAKSIAARIEHLAKEIELEFKETDKLIVVGLLRGSFVFIADLVRELNLPVEVDFLEGRHQHLRGPRPVRKDLHHCGVRSARTRGAVRGLFGRTRTHATLTQLSRTLCLSRAHSRPLARSLALAAHTARGLARSSSGSPTTAARVTPSA